MVSLGAVKEATNTAAVSAFLEERVLPGTGWNLIDARQRYVRLEPPDSYWAVYRVRLGRGAPVSSEESAGAGQRYPEQRELRLVARAAFRPAAWAEFAARVTDAYGARESIPLDAAGFPVAFPETQHAFWIFPVDPSLPSLIAAADPSRVMRLFRAHNDALLDHPARVTGVKVDLARYLPELSAVLRYEVTTNPSAASKTLFGKVQRAGRGERTNQVMQQLWLAFGRNQGALRIPRPRGFFPELSLFLEDAGDGSAVGGDRTAPEFQGMAVHAAEAIAVIQESGLEPPATARLEAELERLDGVLDQFAFVHPKAHFLLRELLLHVRSKLGRAREEQWLPAHGDLKYDQFLFHEGAYTLIDFEYAARAETSSDLGRFCAYLTPSMPKDWQQSTAAEESRNAFLDRYRELRPQATLHRFQLYEAVMLANRAMVAMWAQAPGWERAVETLLVIAMERLNTRLPWRPA
jgi:hypothetical protein